MFVGAEDDGSPSGLTVTDQLLRQLADIRTDGNILTLPTRFNDRIEIINSGGPYGGITRENFGQPSYAEYRNPHIAEAMKVLGFVQRFGVGIQTAQRALADNGNPPTEFDVQKALIRVIVRKAE